jgi:hypothetical protein
MMTRKVRQNLKSLDEVKGLQKVCGSAEEQKD